MMPWRSSCAVALLVLALAACGGAGGSVPPGPPYAGPSVVLAWDAQLLQAVRDLKPPPTVVSRTLAVVHTAEYDAWAAYDPVAVGTRLGGTLRRPASESTLANKSRAVSYAAYRALLDIFPAERALFDGEMATLGYDPGDASTAGTGPSAIGNAAAAAVLAFRHGDGSNQLGDLHAPAYSDYTGYTPVNTPDQIVDPNRWQPLRVPAQDGTISVQVYATPQWGLVTPFALHTGAQFRPPPPPAFGTAEYARQVQQVVDYSAQLNDTTKMIADYWMDGPHSELPPGHWCLFADYVAQRDRHSIDDDVKMLFALGNAVFDAGIAVWDAKRAYDSIRPVSAVHYVFAGKPIVAWAGPGKGTQTISGETWQPYQPAYVVTPPFPEYVSGHSAFSSAAAEVLKDYTGSDAFDYAATIAAGSSRVEPGVVPAVSLTFRYATFSVAADEAGQSRRYGGIHFESGDVAARALGRAVGAAVWLKAQSYFAGHPLP